MKLATAAKKNPTVLSIVVIRTAKNVEGNDVERGRNRKKKFSLGVASSRDNYTTQKTQSIE